MKYFMWFKILIDLCIFGFQYNTIQYNKLSSGNEPTAIKKTKNIKNINIQTLTTREKIKNNIHN